MFIESTRAVRTFAWLACATVLGMIAIFFATGVGQDPLQLVHPAGEYSRILLKNPAALRACIGLDNFFIVFYTALFLLIAPKMMAQGAPRLVLTAAMVLLMLLAFLDMAENFHFLSMLARAEQGMGPSIGEIELQAWESLLKFHIGYLGIFLFGLAMPRHQKPARIFSDLCLYVQLPAGILIYVTPHWLAFPLVFVRFSFFVAALLLSAAAFGPAAAERRPPIGSDVPA